MSEFRDDWHRLTGQICDTVAFRFSRIDAPMSEATASRSHYPLDNYELADRYRRESGRVLLTGTQALVRIALMQRTLDKASGLDTAGFVSGYRG